MYSKNNLLLQKISSFMASLVNVGVCVDTFSICSLTKIERMCSLSLAIAVYFVSLLLLTACSGVMVRPRITLFRCSYFWVYML